MRRREKVRVLGALVEWKVRRADDDDRVRADLCRVRGERDRLDGRLCAALDGHLQPVRGGLEEEIGGDTALALLEQDPFACGTERKDAVEPGLDEEVDERFERCVVQLASGSSERRDGRGKSPRERHQRCGSPARTRSTVAAMRRTRVPGRFASSTHSTYSRR